jgi:hypothetical protein
MTLLTGNIGGGAFPRLQRGELYSFKYANLDSQMTDSMVLNPIIVFSAMDNGNKMHGLNIRTLRNPSVFLEDFEKFYYKDGTMISMQPEHRYAFKYEILKALFIRNPDVQKAWRIYNPLYMKNIEHINIQEARSKLQEPIRVRVSDTGVK